MITVKIVRGGREQLGCMHEQTMKAEIRPIDQLKNARYRIFSFRRLLMDVACAPVLQGLRQPIKTSDTSAFTFSSVYSYSPTRAAMDCAMIKTGEIRINKKQAGDAKKKHTLDARYRAAYLPNLGIHSLSARLPPVRSDISEVWWCYTTTNS